jgi:hypothetical protein
MAQSRKIKQLLDKYWATDTTREEEAELKEWFAGQDPQDNPEISALFEYFKEEKNLAVSEGFEKKIQIIRKEKPAVIGWLGPLWKAAAAIVIIAGLLFVFKKSDIPGKQLAYAEKDTFSDPQKAYQETKRALMLISHNLRTGNSCVAEIKKINQAEQIIKSNTNDK